MLYPQLGCRGTRRRYMREPEDAAITLMGVDGYPEDIYFVRTEHDGSIFLNYL